MRFRLTVLALAALAGCASAPQQPGTLPPPYPYPGAPAHAETPAIASLMESARADASAGRLVNAGASLERALRIEPRNPRLWHELAKVRLRQADYSQAESLAARSNTYAGTDTELRTANQKIIADARSARAQ